MMDIQQKTINTIRTLAVDTVQKANSGHPGAPMGMAAMAYAVWADAMCHTPKDPQWQNRDRFVLSAGHGSMLIYSQPYAHYQYHGKVMAGRAPKHYTGSALTYHGAPMRGSEWEKRMLADHAGDLEKDCAAYINSRKGG